MNRQPLPENHWRNVPFTIFDQYVRDNNLVESFEGMHSLFLNKDQEVKARRLHDFIYDEYQIRIEPTIDNL